MKSKLIKSVHFGKWGKELFDDNKLIEAYYINTWENGDITVEGYDTHFIVRKEHIEEFIKILRGEQ